MEDKHEKSQIIDNDFGYSFMYAGYNFTVVGGK